MKNRTFEFLTLLGCTIVYFAFQCTAGPDYEKIEIERDVTKFINREVRYKLPDTVIQWTNAKDSINFNIKK